MRNLGFNPDAIEVKWYRPPVSGNRTQLLRTDGRAAVGRRKLSHSSRKELGMAIYKKIEGIDGDSTNEKLKK